MTGLKRTLKHRPVNKWPEADRAAFRAAYEPGDLSTGPLDQGAHLAAGTRRMTKFSYRRWLGFLKANYPDDPSMPPAERITPERVRALHDFRRAAATFLVMDAPEKIGLIPGVLQDASPGVSERHYNLARSMQAGRRFAAHLANARNKLRPLAPTSRRMRALPETVTAADPKRDQNAISRPVGDEALMSIQDRKSGEPSCA